MTGLDREHARQRHGCFFYQVAEILFRHDPTGITFKYNLGEFEPKASTIPPRLDNASSHYEALDARKRVRRMFLRRQRGGAKTRHEELATEVWPARPQYKYTLSSAGG